jgi:proteic killer suppression protein
MKIEFADADLRRICSDEAHKLGLPVAVIQAARRRLVQLEAATDERDLRNLKSLNYKKLKGDKDANHTVRVNDQYRIVFTLLDTENPPIINILAICDTH